MKIGKLEIKKHKKYPVIAVNFNGKNLFYIEKTPKKPCVKSKHTELKIVALFAAGVTLFTGISMAMLDDEISTQDSNKSSSQVATVKDNKISSLNFKSEPYGDKHYLTLDEKDLLMLIEEAMKEVDEEYLNNGNKTVFDVKDNVYSQFTKYDILGLLCQESTLRLIELKDENKSIFNTNNYQRFYGVDAKGVIYYGPGMMSEETVKYIVEQDRHATNHFKDYQYFEIDGKKVEITFENLNPYDYVMNSGAKTQLEVKKALAECISYNAKCIYVYLNRLVKDHVKAGTHDKELQVLESYSEFKNLSTQSKQVAIALIAYNNGPTIVYDRMMNGTLFEKDEEGNHIVNVKYAKGVFNHTNNYIDQFGTEFSFQN